MTFLLRNDQPQVKKKIHRYKKSTIDSNTSSIKEVLSVRHVQSSLSHLQRNPRDGCHSGPDPRYSYSSSRAVLSEGGEALCMRTKSARKEAILPIVILLQKFAKAVYIALERKMTRVTWQFLCFDLLINLCNVFEFFSCMVYVQYIPRAFLQVF